MSEIEKVSFNKTEMAALNQLRGLPENVYYMLVTADDNVLQGKGEDFDDLASYLSDEIYYGLSPKSRVKTLQRIYNKVAPQWE